LKKKGRKEGRKEGRERKKERRKKNVGFRNRRAIAKEG